MMVKEHLKEFYGHCGRAHNHLINLILEAMKITKRTNKHDQQREIIYNRNIKTLKESTTRKKSIFKWNALNA